MTKEQAQKKFFTVNKLIEKLKQLQEQGYGEELVGTEDKLFKYCEYVKCKYVKYDEDFEIDQVILS